jgi:enoyl-CoA hydratase/carnithine racemase
MMTDHTGATARDTFALHVADGIARIAFDGEHHSNAMSSPRMRALAEILRELEATDEVAAVVLYGGTGNSFAVGGDFHEVSHFSGGSEVDDWIDHITDLYVASLEVTKPTVAAVEGYAIGIGLQLALTCDFRVGAETSVLRMPEFQLGIACNFGAYMLERSAGRAVMQNMLLSCEEWPAERSVRDGLLHQVVPAADVLSTALERATAFRDYNPAAVRGTKPHMNREYVRGLHALRESAKASHRAGFASGRPQERMRTIVGQA